MFRVNVAGEGLRDLARDLKRAGGGLRPKLTAELREPTKRIYKAVEREVLTGSMAGSRVPGARKRFPSTLGRGNHVRRPVLRGLEWKVSTSAGSPRAEITWRPSKILARVRPLLAYLTGQKKRLRHPVMGNRSTWVSQRMPDAWAPTKKLADGAQKAAGQVLDHTAAIIAGRK